MELSVLFFLDCDSKTFSNFNVCCYSSLFLIIRFCINQSSQTSKMFPKKRSLWPLDFQSDLPTFILLMDADESKT